MAFGESSVESDKAATPSGAVGCLDFLELPFGETAQVVRDGHAFQLDGAWSVARFGQHTLKRGWWLLESESTADLRGVEVRLTSALNPLMTLLNSHNGARNSGMRIYLPAPETFDVSLLLSPWPGRVAVTRLRLRCLGGNETAMLFARSVKRLFRTQNGFGKLVHLGRQFMRGRPLGLRLEPAPIVSPLGASPRIQSTVNTNEQPAKLIQQDGFDGYLGAEDTLDPRALAIISQELARSPELKVIYCDAMEGKVIVPRPNRDAELGRWFEVASPPVFFRKGVGAAHADPQKRLDEVIAKWGPDVVARIPLPLVKRPKGNWPLLPMVPAPTLLRQPRVSVIVPTKFRIDLLAKALEGLSRRTGYPNLEVVVVDNGSTDKRLPGVLEHARKAFDLIHVRDMGKFNFSRLVNLGVRTSSGEIILLMNDDVEPTQWGWLHRMIESAMSPDVGAVGARLLFPDRTIQHAGVSMGIGGICGHLWKGLREEDALRCPYVVYPGERMAVTGACLAVRRDVFDRAGGFDEAAFPVALNDIDFCLRVRALGLRNIYRGDAVLIHHESQSRGQDSETAERRRRAGGEVAAFLSRWRPLIQDDPFSSPEFDRRTESGAVHYAALAGAA